MLSDVPAFKVIVVASLTWVVVIGNALGQVSTPTFAPREAWYGDELVGNETDLKAQIDELTKVRYLLFPHVYRAFIEAGRTPKAYNVSQGCERDLTRYYWALNNQKAWAWRLYDATGKQGAGLFHGALTWKGNFQECLNTLGYKTTNNFFTHDHDEPKAQYCSVFLETPRWLKEVVTNLELPFPVPMPPFISDVCVPESCTEKDLSHVVQIFVTTQAWGNMNFSVTDTRCFHGRHIHNDPAALCTATCLVMLCCCVGMGTMYDIYLRRRKPRIKHGSEFQIGYKKDTKQYGILKVILAAPSKTKLQRRYTICGCDMPDQYKLQEIKVHRQKLLEHGSTTTLPDTASFVSDGAASPFEAKHCAFPFVQRSLSQPAVNHESPRLPHEFPRIPLESPGLPYESPGFTHEPHPPNASKEKDEWLTTVIENDDDDQNVSENSSAESDTSSLEMTRLSEVDDDEDDEDVESQVPTSSAARDGVLVDLDEASDHDRDSDIKVISDGLLPNGFAGMPLPPTALVEMVDEDSEWSPWRMRGEEGDGQTKQQKAFSTGSNVTPESEAGENGAVLNDFVDYLGKDDRSDARTPLLINGTTEDSIDCDRIDREGVYGGEDLEEKSLVENGGQEGKLTNGNNNDVQVVTAPCPDACPNTCPLMNPEDNTDDDLPLIAPKKLPAPKPIQNKAVSMLKALTLQHRSHSDPCILEKGKAAKDEGKVPEPLVLPPLEVTVPDNKEHKFDARVPWSPAPKKVTHRMSPHGQVFERQISVMSEEDPMAPLNKDHALFDIPEEPQEAKENGDVIKPEVEIRIRDRVPMVKDTAAGFLRGLFLSFSFRRSTKRVMAEGSPDTLFCLNGVRVLSISWIVLGNVYLIMYLNPDVVDNHVDGVKLTQTLWVQAVINTTLAADSFYILSGTLGAYNFMKLKKKHKGKNMCEVMTFKEYLMLMFHRLCRIGPCYWIVLLTFTNLMPYMGKGPRWSYEITSVETCKQKWWANALFFSNFYQADKMCMPHTYYLVNDFQFALISPLFLIPLLCKPILGFAMLGGLVALQIISTLILDHGINGNVLRMQETDYFSSVYVKPYCRIGVYAIGLGLGYLLWATKRQMKFKKIPLAVMWLLSLTVIFTLPYITHLENKVGGRKWTGVETALYEALSRPLWGLALAWIIFACSTGQGAFVNKLLSWNAFLPLCRTTYGVYLLHPMLIAVVIESRHNGIYIDFAELTYEFVANLVVSYMLAFLLITFVESPFTTLESNIRTHLGQHKHKVKKRH